FLCARQMRILHARVLVPASSPSAVYTLSLHDALPIWEVCGTASDVDLVGQNKARECRTDVLASARTQSSQLAARNGPIQIAARRDRKSTRLNSSHQIISYAVFCLKKKKKTSLRLDTIH